MPATVELLEYLNRHFIDRATFLASPGLWIDEPLAKYGLGLIPLIQPAPIAEPAAPKLCA